MLMERRRQATRITLAGSLLSGAAPDELVNRCFSPFFAWKYGSQTRFWGRDYRSAPPLDKAYSGNFFEEFPVPEQIVSFFRFLLSPKFLETPPGEQNSKLRLHLPSRQREPQGLARETSCSLRFSAQPFQGRFPDGEEAFIRKPLPGSPGHQGRLA